MAFRYLKKYCVNPYLNHHYHHRNYYYYYYYYYYYWGRDSVVGIATRYRLEGPGIESR